jgi:hypothetical protein
MNKKGEITTQQIVLIIVLIASFVVILFFLFRLNLGKTTDQETCYNSVVQRGSGVLPKESVPLNCETQYICITKDGSCEKMTSPTIEKVNTKNEIYNILANQMADCWWMFGEGKLNYVGEGFTKQLYCSICSQIAFDNSANSIFTNGEIDKKEFYDYLSKTNYSDEKSYLEYLTGIKDSNAIAQSITLGKIDFNKQYYIMTGIFNQIGVVTWIAGGVAVGIGSGIAIASGGTSIPATVVILSSVGIGGGAGYLVGTTIKGSSGNEYLTPTIIEANSETFDSLKCASIKTIG